MDLASAQVIGAGIAAIGIGVAASGVGNVFASFLEGALRNPSAADGQQGRLFIGFAAAELLGLIAFAVAMMILYAPPAATPVEAVVVEAAAVDAPVAEEAAVVAPAE